MLLHRQTRQMLLSDYKFSVIFNKRADLRHLLNGRWNAGTSIAHYRSSLIGILVSFLYMKALQWLPERRQAGLSQGGKEHRKEFWHSAWTPYMNVPVCRGYERNKKKRENWWREEKIWRKESKRVKTRKKERKKERIGKERKEWKQKERETEKIQW